MEFEFSSAKNIGQCIFCLKWQNSCVPFRICENSSLPPLYRTLYTFKNVVCPTCKESGHSDLCQMTKQYMDDYIGG
jgi:hypothetical protein